MASRLFGVDAQNPATMATAAGIMLLVGSAAAYLPARRASNVDPLVMLR